jgi:hypothetical protein
MRTRIVNAIAALAAAVCLAITLLLLPATIRALQPWLGPLSGGWYPMATARVLAALLFGLAFGLIPVRGVPWKALTISICAVALFLAMMAAGRGLHTAYAKQAAVECGVFVALFCTLAVMGHLLSQRLHLRASAAVGSVAFVALFVLFTVLPAYTSIPRIPMTPEARLDRSLQEIRYAKTDMEKFYALRDAAKQSFVLGHIEDARQFATELLRIAKQCPGDWNYGNAIHDGNVVLGRIALREGHVEDAKKFLLAAGGTPGSPQLNSFGPNMSLANDLLEFGERDVVLEYFDLCRKFWAMGDSKLTTWSDDIRVGKVPDFGANLVY